MLVLNENCVKGPLFSHSNPFPDYNGVILHAVNSYNSNTKPSQQKITSGRTMFTCLDFNSDGTIIAIGDARGNLFVLNLHDNWFVCCKIFVQQINAL